MRQRVRSEPSSSRRWTTSASSPEAPSSGVPATTRVASPPTSLGRHGESELVDEPRGEEVVEERRATLGEDARHTGVVKARHDGTQVDLVVPLDPDLVARLEAGGRACHEDDVTLPGGERLGQVPATAHDEDRGLTTPIALCASSSRAHEDAVGELSLKVEDAPVGIRVDRPAAPVATGGRPVEGADEVGAHAASLGPGVEAGEVVVADLAALGGGAG